MLPNSQRGFAPTVRGIANSSAIVTIRQNGYVIYQSNVPAGAFEINDLYPSSNSGDLEVTIEESDGTQRRFIQPYSSLPMMQRPGHLNIARPLDAIALMQTVIARNPNLLKPRQYMV